MAFFLTLAFPPGHPSFASRQTTDLDSLVATANNTVLRTTTATERQPENRTIAPPFPPQLRNGRKIFFYKTALLTVNLCLIVGLLLFLYNDKDRSGVDFLHWISLHPTLLPFCLLLLIGELVLSIGLLREHLLLCRLNALKCATYSFVALYLFITVDHFVERTWPLCCDLLLYPLSGHCSLLYLLELNRARRWVATFRAVHQQLTQEGNAHFDV